MRTLLLLPALGLVWAQAWTCGTDLYKENEERHNPALVRARSELEAAIAQWIERHAPALRTQNTCPESDYVIPVVVHIIHSGYGQPDSLPIDRVLLQMEQLFNDYRKRPYTKGYSSGVDTRIELSLATKDPSGNSHPGVTYTRYTDAGLTAARVNMSGSPNSASTMKANTGWDRSKYLNIWVVKQICTDPTDTQCLILGFATFPNGTSDTNEGVTVISSYFGNVGGGQTTTHEAGHYFNLYHTFQGGCGGTSNSTCASSGDRVCDTPPTYQANYGGAKRQNTCYETTSATGGDVPDLVRDYMDYLDDGSLDIFTEGQRVRMQSALQTASDRQQWQSTNLQATGAGPYGRIKANFALQGCEQPPCYVCPGQTLSFTSYSWGKPNAFLWEIRQGGTVVASSTQGPCATLTAPSTPGTYDVRLQVTNLAGSDDTTYTGFLVVRDPTQAASYPFSEGFEGTVFPPAGWVRLNPDFAVGGSIQWEGYRSTGRGSFGASNGMARLRNFSYLNRTQRDHLITPFISIPSTATNPTLEFDVYYRVIDWQSTANNNNPYLYADTLAVYVSSDCGTTWQRIFYQGGTDLADTAAIVQTGAYGPQAVPPTGPNTAWSHKVVPLPSSYIGQKILIRFENITEMGNTLYLDSIQVRNGATTGSFSASLSQPEVSVGPNPAQDEVFLLVRRGDGDLLRYRLLTLTGQELLRGAFESSGPEVRHTLPVGSLAKGLYLIETELRGQRRVWRLAIQ